MSSIIFKTPDKGWLAELIFNSIKHLKNNYKEVIYINFSEDFINKIISTDFNTVKEEIIKKIEENEIDLKVNLMEFKNFWKNRENLFFKKLEKILETKFNEDFTCYFTTIFRGSYHKNNKVIINLRKSKDNIYISHVLAEEILHLIYRDMWRKTIRNIEQPWKINFTNQKFSIWEVSEVIPEFTLKDKEFIEFNWQHIKRGYPFIDQIKQQLNPFWINKKNFKDFLLKVHKNFFLELFITERNNLQIIK